MNRTTETIIRTAVLVLALANQVLSALGKSPLPIEDSAVETLISAGATIFAAVWAWWKNNSLTAAAQKADEYMDAIKAKGGQVNV